MREQQIQGILSGIRDEFILEAEPRRLAALLPADEVPAGTVILSSPAAKSKKRSKRWIPWVAAAVLTVVGLNLGLYAGMAALIGQGGFLSGGMTSAGSAGGLIGSLFPFLSPETDPPYEVTVRDPEDATEPPYACADGHDFEETVERDATCYAVAKYNLVCRTCGFKKLEKGDELLDHTYENGYCTVCGLIEGAHPLEDCTFTYEKNCGYTYPDAPGVLVSGYILTRIEGEIGDTLILPNVYYTEENGLLPVVALAGSLLQGRSEFSKLVLPNKLLDTGNPGTFMNCTSLTEIVWPESLRRIGCNTFEGCTSLKEVTVPDTVISFSPYVFKDCTSLEKATILKTPTDLFHQSTFEGCTALTEVHLPADLTELPATTFLGCKALTSIELPPQLETIGFEAFFGCTGLTEIHVPSTVRTIEHSAFQRCSSLQSIELPQGLQWVDEQVFSKCTALERVVLPDGLIAIKSQAFYECSSLAEISFPSSLQVIDLNAFTRCAALRELVLPSNLQILNGWAFSECTALERVVMPSAPKLGMGQSVFEDCYALREIALPDDMTAIEPLTFHGCTSLVSIRLPDGLTRIALEAFLGCSSLEELVIPDHVTEIGSAAFRRCASLRRVTLPSSLKAIAQAAFMDCPALTEIHYLGTVAEWQAISPKDSSIATAVYCTDGVVNADGSVMMNP